MDYIRLFGYYDGLGNTPAYDPGIDVPCIYCRRPLDFPLRTISFMVPGQDRSYFYRLHTACEEEMKVKGEAGHYEGLIVDRSFSLPPGNTTPYK